MAVLYVYIYIYIVIRNIIYSIVMNWFIVPINYLHPEYNKLVCNPQQPHCTCVVTLVISCPLSVGYPIDPPSRFQGKAPSDVCWGL